MHLRVSYFPMVTQAIVDHPDFDGARLTPPGRLDTGAARGDPRRPDGSARRPSCALRAHRDERRDHWGSPTVDEEKRITTGGFPLHGTEVRVVDPETDEDLPPETPGRSSSAGRGLFDGYHNDPEKTAEAMRGGWFHSGDRGKLDEDGRLTYLGRLKDMLKVGGENVAALEIEAFLGTHRPSRSPRSSASPTRATTRYPRRVRRSSSPARPRPRRS